MAKTSKNAKQTSANIGFEKQIWDKTIASLIQASGKEIILDSPCYKGLRGVRFCGFYGMT